MRILAQDTTPAFKLCAFLVLVSPFLTNDGVVLADDDTRGARAQNLTLARIEQDRPSPPATTGDHERSRHFSLLAPEPVGSASEPQEETRGDSAGDASTTIPNAGAVPAPPARATSGEEPGSDLLHRWRFTRPSTSADEDFPLMPRGGFVARPMEQSNRNIEAMKRLAHRIGFRHVRSFFRSELKDQFYEDPSFRYEEYLQMREDIGRLGRGDTSAQDIHAEEIVESQRHGLDDPYAVEKDVPVVDWGPLRVDDRGSLSVGFGRLSHERGSADVQLAPEETPCASKALFAKDTYSFDTDLKFRPDVHALVRGDGYREAFGKIVATAEVEFLTPILRKRFMSTELEVTVDGENRTSLFVNFILYGN